ncbi:tRNA1(Val) (adenine(37)-N6)-methyltransferase [Muriicola marianensis]|nr:methyltransferase [Muriicola marianensis]
MESPFRFKQFEICQDRCAMKVGTDGVLLGAWTPVDTEPASILDIGTGTGLIALMLAQRTMADTIDAVEIDGDAFEQCVENFEASPWSDRLFCYHAGLDEMVEECDASYDLIVSNPPFHSETVTSGSESRDRARQNIALPFSELIHGVEMLLADEGVFATIIPFHTETSFRQMAREAGLNLFKATRVKGTPKSPIKRSLLAFSRREQEVQEDQLTIEKRRHEYTKDYKALCRDFYLKM